MTADIAWRVLEHRDLTTDAVLRLIRTDDVEPTDGVALIDGDVLLLCEQVRAEIDLRGIDDADLKRR
ncbi:hypothetical protein G3480_23955 [Thiorhodococcus mannitoliphagus]|uniref:Uncharacterized protein n=1 Tax=Thiorhodococcus mannitoliphagus TaxID=329406 RepID=A0A6P1E5L4_9GAMM|nr:hypothetical protein [Thiorhodococcus mannitoliphagus]NEX23314.1 hypothetical protein [Thiorhodococcus mannitoliphagus]